MKLFKLLCTMLLTMTLVACGNKTIDIKIQETNVIDDYINYEILYCEVTDEIEPPITKGYYTYYKPQLSSNVLIDMVLKVTNISDEAIKMSDLQGEFEIGDVNIQTINVFNKSDTALSQSESIEASSTHIVHMYGEIDKNTDMSQDITFTLTANEQQASLTYKIEDLEVCKKYLLANDTISDNNIEVTIKKTLTSNQINPTKPGTTYFYYKTEDGATFAAIQVTIKNKSNQDLSTSDLLGVKAKIGDQKYIGYTLVEDSNQKNILSTTTIQTQASHIAYLVVEIPSEDKDKDIEFSIYYDNQFYYLKK